MAFSTTLAVFVAFIASTTAQDFGLIGFGAGTTGGGSAAATTVTSCSAFKTAATATGAAVITISGLLSGCGIIDVKSDKTIQGSGSSSGFSNGGGIRLKGVSNVIIRNLNFGLPPAAGDSLALDTTTKVWIDHNTFKTAGLTGDKDDYDGQLDITHASDYVTVSWNRFTDHWKASLVGHSDSNSAEDTGHLRITYHHNYWSNINSRTPSLRFGTGHIFNSVYENVPTSGINSRMGAQVLSENNIFTNVQLAMVTDLDSDTDGYLSSSGNVLTNSTTRITQTASFRPSYTYQLGSTSTLATIVANCSGAGKYGVTSCGGTVTSTTASSSATTTSRSTAATGGSTTASTTSPSSSGGGTGCTTSLYGQCGGLTFTGCTTCAAGSTCKYSNDWYSQCV